MSLATEADYSVADLAAFDDGKNVLCILDRTGDTRIMWDPNRPDEADTAKAAFDAAIAKGMRAFKVTDDGGKGEQIKTWADAQTAGKVIMAPALVGG